MYKLYEVAITTGVMVEVAEGTRGKLGPMMNYRNSARDRKKVAGYALYNPYGGFVSRTNF